MSVPAWLFDDLPDDDLVARADAWARLLDGAAEEPSWLMGGHEEWFWAFQDVPSDAIDYRPDPPPCPDENACRYWRRHPNGPWTCEHNHPRRTS